MAPKSRFYNQVCRETCRGISHFQILWIVVIKDFTCRNFATHSQSHVSNSITRNVESFAPSSWYSSFRGKVVGIFGETEYFDSSALLELPPRPRPNKLLNYLALYCHLTKHSLSIISYLSFYKSVLYSMAINQYHGFDSAIIPRFSASWFVASSRSWNDSVVRSKCFRSFEGCNKVWRYR